MHENLAVEPFSIFLGGESGTGKASFAKHVDDPDAEFDERYVADGNSEVVVTLESTIGPLRVNFLVLSGQSGLDASLSHHLLQDHNEGGMMFYSWDSKKTVTKLPIWISPIKEAFGESLPIVIVGNEWDLPEHAGLVGDRLAALEERTFMKRLRANHTWYEHVSVKNDPRGLKEPLQGLLRQILRRRDVPDADMLADSLVLL